MTRTARSLSVLLSALLASLATACSGAGAEGGTGEEVVTTDPPQANGSNAPAAAATAPAPAPTAVPRVVTNTTVPKLDGASKDSAY